MLIPHHLNPLSREKDIQARIYPPSSGIGYRWQLQKHPLFLVFSENLPETTAKKYPPFPRLWERACGPLMHSSGGPGLPVSIRLVFRMHVVQLHMLTRHCVVMIIQLLVTWLDRSRNDLGLDLDLSYGQLTWDLTWLALCPKHLWLDLDLHKIICIHLWCLLLNCICV